MVPQKKFFNATVNALLLIPLFYVSSIAQIVNVASINTTYNTLSNSILIKQQNNIFMNELTPWGFVQTNYSAETMLQSLNEKKGNGTTAGDILKQQQQLAVQELNQPNQKQIQTLQQNQLNGRQPEQNEQQRQMKEFSALMFEVSSNTKKYSSTAYYQSVVYKNDFTNYINAFNKLKDMLEGRTPLSIADAYYIEEAAYGNVPLSFEEYKNIIKQNTEFIRQWLKENKLNVNDPEVLHFGIQKFNSDTLVLNTAENLPRAHAPYFYDYVNYNSDDNRTNYFITKSLATGGGQCHTLPTNYLIIAESLGVDANLAYSLSHSFIRYKNNMGTVQNYETTIDQLMPDQFYLETLPVMAKAKSNKIYISSLNKKQIIASVMIDLAVNYVSEHWLYEKAFIQECMTTASAYFPNKEYFNDAYNYLNKLLYADAFNSKVQEKGIKDFSQIDKDPETLQAYNNLTDYMEKINSLGIQGFPESEYMRMMEYYDTKKKLQKAKNINGKQQRNLFFNQ